MKKVLFALLLLVLLAACAAPAPASPTPDATAIFQGALLTATYAVQGPTATPAPSETPSPTPQPSATPYSGPPPQMPAVFTTSLLNPAVQPQAYIADTCQYLQERWNSRNAAPGTVVMPIMYHSITEDYNEVAPDGSQIKNEDLQMTLRHAKELGFETITTQQLVDFLEHNAPIPRRSLLLIVDDRRPGVIREHFWPFLQEYQWTVTLGWLIGDTDSKPASPLNSVPENYKTLWEQMEAYNASGMLDVQAHGYVHNINASEGATDEFLRHEIVDSRKVLQEHFYCKDHASGQVDPNCQTVQPLAYIWPGGSFTRRAAEIAREAGYHLGFTINPRGPVLYNWVPLVDAVDPASPSWLPEIPIGDPLMTLPRYWSADAAYRLDEVANIGEEAAAYARQHKAEELLYYDVVCKAQYGEIPNRK